MSTPLQHLAIIMDGNGRWAKALGLPSLAGHQRGADAAKIAIKTALGASIPYLTLFGFSSENWARPQDEVTGLMQLLRRYLQSDTAEFHANNIRLRFIGERARFDPDIVELMQRAETLTANNTALNLTVALNYGGRAEILRAASRLLFQSYQALDKNEGFAAWQMDEKKFSEYLDTSDLPDPDLIIRTSGEKRLSNFLLWQSAYAEFEFLDVLWPDFTAADFLAAIDNFRNRERRFGARHA
jgi:undecaprenyl diphosphate synthase